MKLPFYLAWVFVLVMLSHALELALIYRPIHIHSFYVNMAESQLSHIYRVELIYGKSDLVCLTQQFACLSLMRGRQRCRNNGEVVRE